MENSNCGPFLIFAGLCLVTFIVCTSFGYEQSLKEEQKQYHYRMQKK